MVGPAYTVKYAHLDDPSPKLLDHYVCFPGLEATLYRGDMAEAGPPALLTQQRSTRSPQALWCLFRPRGYPMRYTEA